MLDHIVGCHTVLSMKRRIIGVVLAVSLLSISSFAYTQNFGPGPKGPGAAGQQSLLDAWERDCTASADPTSCLSRHTDEAIDLWGPAHSAGILLKLVGRSDRFSGACHTVMHQIGTALIASDEHLAPNDPGWLRCGGGLIHGYAEHAPLNLEDGNLRSEVAAHCSSFREERSLYANCIHGLAHEVFLVTEADVDLSVQVCRSTFSDPGGYETANCYNGVFMQLVTGYSDEYLGGKLLYPVDTADWDALEAQCGTRDETATRMCLLTLVELVGTRIGDSPAGDATASYLHFCTVRHPTLADKCGIYVGIMLARLYQTLSPVDLVSICAPERQGACIQGLIVGVEQMYGFPAVSVATKLCPLVPDVGLRPEECIVSRAE